MKALLVDGLNLVRRIYAAVPQNSGHDDLDQASSPDPAFPNAHIENVIHSCAASLKRALNRHTPSHCVVIFEQSGRNWRHQLFPEYKKDRSPKPQALHLAIGKIEFAFGEIGVPSFSLMGYEADDILATLAKKIAHHKGHAVILSTDRILCQILDVNIEVFDHFADRNLDIAMVAKKFQVNPSQIPDLLALAGDSSASIPGIKSIGIRTAAKLINDYGTLEKVLNAADNMPGKLGSKLFNGKQDARLAQQLFSVKTDIELGVNLNQFRYSPDAETP